MTFYNKGKSSNAKVILHRLPDDEGSDLLYFLTDRQVQALLQGITYLRWVTRHATLPSDLDSPSLLNDWVDDLEKRLMFPYDPMQDICAKIVDCIMNNDATKEAIANMLIDNDTFNNYYGEKHPLKPSELTGNLVTNIGCNKDILWAQCVQIVEYTHSAIVDLLEILEVQSNNFELMQKLELIPFIGTIIDEVQVDTFLEFVDYLFEMVGEQYISGYTETIPDGLKWDMAEEIFCLCKDDCEITIDRIIQAYGNLLMPYTSSNWSNMSELLETVIGVNDNSAIVPIVMHNVVWNAVKFTGFIVTTRLTLKALEVILKIAENDANDDWETLTDCIIPVGDCLDFTASANGWYPSDAFGTVNNYNFGEYKSGEGLAPHSPSGNFFWATAANTELSINSITIKLREPQSDIIFGRLGSVYCWYSGSPTLEITFDETTHPDFFPFSFAFGAFLSPSTNNVALSQRIEEVCYEVNE